MNKWLRRAGPAAVALLVLAGIVWGFRPRPVEVDLGEVIRGPMRVTVDEEGKTRIRERYVVSAPLAGSLLRVQLKAGTPVVAGQTVLAVLEPGDPAFLNARERAEAEARVKSGEAAKQQSDARVAAARKEYDLAAGNLARIRQSHAAGVASAEELHTAEIREQVRSEDVRAAQFAVRVAAFELELARAALVRSEPKSALPPEDRRLEIRAPVDGKVLRVFQESAAVVNPGTRILELGDPSDLEMVIEVLSTDAVKIAPGDLVVVERWGGEEPLAGRVRQVEPAAFLKVSALGVEEQRVNVIADFTDPLAKRKTLGDAYRVEARIVVWEANAVVKVPAGSLFRRPSGGWAVFSVQGGRARLTPVEVGRANGAEAEVRAGLVPGDRVVLHPSDRVKDGARVVGR
ncbi:MAG TPA: HlyD family efflux transporter periplasmic adaptor subunit [Gemmata sp.]|nr:HlyD family efflux transporter periplasmic adaptor subunit [Gemmata sp.]